MEASSRSEIRVSHYENLIRAESGLPLRTHYSAVIERTTGRISPNPKTTLIDKAGNSVYYNTPQRMYPGNIPSLIMMV